MFKVIDAESPIVFVLGDNRYISMHSVTLNISSILI